MIKNAFIRATEVWIPTRDRSRLELASGLYGPLQAFEQISKNITFAHGEGLPGRAWAEGHPIVLTDLVNSYFMRAEQASAAGLTCAIAVPIFAGQFLTSVLVLFCGDDHEHIGALEVWHTPDGSSQMKLLDGYFGNAEKFKIAARHTQFGCGIGLPGQVWQSGMPIILADMGQSTRVLRWETAQQVGINRGIGIPCGRDGDDPYVLTMLSALGTPIAHRFECWLPNENHDSISFLSGFCEKDPKLNRNLNGATINIVDGGVAARILLGGIPVISTNLLEEAPAIANSAGKAGYETLVAMPIIKDAKVKAIVAWYG